MKKQLTKQQIEKRKNILHKTKNIIFYLSLAFNVLIGTCLIISGCSQNKSVSADYQTTFQSQLVRRNYAFSEDPYNNNNCFVYSTRFNNYQPDHYYYYNNVINTKQNNITIYSQNDISAVERMSYLAQWEHPQDNPIAWYGHIELRFQVYAGEGYYNSIYRLEYEKRANVNYWSYIPNDNTVYIEAVGFNTAYLVSIGVEDLQPVFDFFFPLVDYQDYNLTQNWSPFSYVPINNDFVYTSSTFSFGATKRFLLENTMFAINGRFYTNMYIEITNNAKLDGGTIPVSFKNGDYTSRVYNGGQGSYVNWIINVWVENSYTGDLGMAIWLINNGTADDNSNLLVDVLGYFKDYSRGFVRLFDINLNHTTTSNYVNGNVLNVQSNYATGSPNGNSYGGSGSIQSTFTLFGNAFKGLASIFALQVLPGLTLGIIIFIPLVATIIFAIIKVIKK